MAPLWEINFFTMGLPAIVLCEKHLISFMKVCFHFAQSRCLIVYFSRISSTHRDALLWYMRRAPAAMYVRRQHVTRSTQSLSFMIYPLYRKCRRRCCNKTISISQNERRQHVYGRKSILSVRI